MNATIGFSLEIRDRYTDRLRERININSKEDYFAAIEKYENDNIVVVYDMVTPFTEGITVAEYYELHGVVV